jgi:hypothetical protein
LFYLLQRIAEIQRKAQEALEEAMTNTDGQPKPPSIMPRIETTPPASMFKELKPSEKRYSILQKTEL